MKKQILKILLAGLLVCLVLPIQTIHGEPDYSDSSYWNNYCTGSGNGSSACRAYRDYLSSQSSDLANQLNEINAKKAKYEQDIAQYKDEIAAYQSQITSIQEEVDTINGQIESKQVEIAQKQDSIDALEVQIDSTQKDIDTIGEKIKRRMVTSQQDMHVNRYLDVIMGAQSFEDLFRILSGLKAISDDDNQATNELVDLREQLKTEEDALEQEKQELQEDEQELEDQKKQRTDKQSELLVAQQEVQVAEEAAQQSAAALEAEGNHISSQIDSIKGTLDSVAERINNGSISVPDSNGWYRPVPGAYRSAGTWNYPGGGIHLGYDFATSAGTPLHAVGNGFVINSANGCPVGYLGSNCGSQFGGSQGGGNQVYLLTAINGSLYAVKYLHMQLNSPIATGKKVSAGDVVGRAGSSGNSSGVHCHVEIFYLGDASNFASYMAGWNGDLSFGAGWAGGSYGPYGRRCQDGVGAPCRIRPEDIFGY